MSLTESQRTFLENNHAAAMITIAKDGMPCAVRVGIALVNGKLWSSGTQDRVRTTRLRRDPRCTLFVFDKQYSFLTLETTVNILDGPDAPELNLRLMRLMQNKPTGSLNWFGHELDTEAISNGMPTFKLEGNLVHFGAFKNHLGFYPVPSGLDHFREELTPYKSGKGSAQFPYNQPIPYELISQITQFRAAENLKIAAAKKKKK
jgi:uncharacterized protein YdhG (YjbR/CyaY superfamily)